MIKISGHAVIVDIKDRVITKNGNSFIKFSIKSKREHSEAHDYFNCKMWNGNSYFNENAEINQNCYIEGHLEKYKWNERWYFELVIDQYKPIRTATTKTNAEIEEPKETSGWDDKVEEIDKEPESNEPEVDWESIEF